MSSKNTYWITDPEGTFAPVEGAEARDRWTRVHGWSEASEPDRHDFVWLRHENPELGATRMTWEAAQLDAWAGRGWAPGAPNEPGAAPAPAVEPVAEPTKTTKSGSAGDKKE
jgi:hypothetical protein